MYFKTVTGYFLRFTKPVATFYRTGPTQWSVDYEPEYGELYKIQIVTENNDTLSGQTRFPYDQKLVGWERWATDTHQHLGEDFTKTKYRILSYEVRIGTKKYLNYHAIDGVVYKDYHFIVYEFPSSKACKMWIFPHTDGTPVDSECLNNPLEVDEGVFEYRKYYYYHSEAFDYKGPAHPYAKLVATDHPFVDGFNTIEGVVSSLEWCNRPLNRQGILNCSQWTRILTPDLPLHSSFLRIDQPASFTRGLSKEELKESYLCTNSSFLVIADYDTENYQSILDCTNEVHFVSDEYDSYLRDLYTRKGYETNFILSAYDSSDMYSNIAGGVGIFGADNITWDMIDIYVERAGSGGYYETSVIEL